MYFKGNHFIKEIKIEYVMLSKNRILKFMIVLYIFSLPSLHLGLCPFQFPEFWQVLVLDEDIEYPPLQ